MWKKLLAWVAKTLGTAAVQALSDKIDKKKKPVE